MPAVFVAAGIAVLSLVESNQVPQTPLNDKVVHGAMYAVLAVLLMLPYSLRSSWRIYLSAFVLAAGYGLLMECLQEYCTSTRTMEALDILANIVGAIIGLLLFAFVRWLWKRIATSMT